MLFKLNVNVCMVSKPTPSQNVKLIRDSNYHFTRKIQTASYTEFGVSF